MHGGFIVPCVLAFERGQEVANPRFELIAGLAEGGEDLLGCPAASDGGIVDGPVELADVRGEGRTVFIGMTADGDDDIGISEHLISQGLRLLTRDINPLLLHHLHGEGV